MSDQFMGGQVLWGVGATKQLSLRVSIGVLIKVLFTDPKDKKVMLALERTATLRQANGGREVIVKARPFGGAIRINDPEALKSRIGEFHYDSERSRQERDLRIFVNPESWEAIKVICADMKEMGKGFLDNTPDRELAEEFKDSLNIRIGPGQYELKARGMITEDVPGETSNVNSQGSPTVRIYYIFEAVIKSSEIIELILNSSRRHSDEDLEKMALEDAGRGGRGRANAVLAVSLDELKEFYHSVSAGSLKLNELIRFRGHSFDGHVIAVLDDIAHPGYKREIWKKDL